MIKSPKFKVDNKIVVFKSLPSIWWTPAMDDFVMPSRFSYDFVFEVKSVKKIHNKFVYALSNYVEGNEIKHSLFWFPEDSLISLSDYKYQENSEDVIYFN